MDKRRINGVGSWSHGRTGIKAVALAAALVVTGIACRQKGPTEDPRTPPNSPIPEIDRTDEDPKASPAPIPGAGDAGS